MRIKHSKFRNTGLIYELLVRQITSDLISRKDSPAVNILRKYYSGNSALVQEYGLYKTIVEGVDLPTTKADHLINASLKAGRAINQRELANLKYSLISEIKGSYDLESFFSVPVKEYKTLAAFYCLLEADRSKELIDPESIVTNKATLLEHMTCRFQPREDVVDSLIEEYSNYDKDLRLLTFKVLLEKYNQKYGNLLEEQKAVLKKFISLGNTKELRTFLNEELSKLSTQLTHCHNGMQRGIEKIKLTEAIKMLQPIPNTEKVTDDHLVRVLQFYDLLNEIKKVV